MLDNRDPLGRGPLGDIFFSLDSIAFSNSFPVYCSAENKCTGLLRKNGRKFTFAAQYVNGYLLASPVYWYSYSYEIEIARAYDTFAKV